MKLRAPLFAIVEYIPKLSEIQVALFLKYTAINLANHNAEK